MKKEEAYLRLIMRQNQLIITMSKLILKSVKKKLIKIPKEMLNNDFNMDVKRINEAAAKLSEIRQSEKELN